MRKILIVDDAPINRELLKIIFEEDFDIIEAGNGVEAIEKLDEYKDELCLIFLDLIMPEKSHEGDWGIRAYTCYYDYRRGNHRVRCHGI